MLGPVDSGRLSEEDRELLREWYRILSDTDRKFLKFLGDGEDGTPGHNHRMLAYFASLPDDRQRLIVQHGWQIHDHMCNTGRANASEWDWRYGLTVVLTLSALAFAVDYKWFVVGAYLGGALFFLFRPIWRGHSSKTNGL